MHHSHLIAFLAVLAAGSGAAGRSRGAPTGCHPVASEQALHRAEQIFQQPNEIQWFKINLEKGKDYAIGGVHLSEEGPNPTLALFDAAGRQFLSFEMTLDYTDFVGGSEFRAPATATFFIKAETTGSVAPLSYFWPWRTTAGKGRPRSATCRS